MKKARQLLMKKFSCIKMKKERQLSKDKISLFERYLKFGNLDAKHPGTKDLSAS